MPADPHRLAEHARQRHRETLTRAEQALTELADAGQPVTVALLADRAGVSRSWIYTQPALHERVKQLRHQQASSDRVHDTVTRASDDSNRHRLALAHERISQLRGENQQLRDALAHAHGQLRTARISTDSQQSAELGALLQLLHDWLAADQTARTSLDTFAEAPFTSRRLREDLIRFTYLSNPVVNRERIALDRVRRYRMIRLARKPPPGACRQRVI
ncbi:hypothetical protein IU459_35480 [Nocardia amamiensis]|uniref:Transposase n=1 Tax=Nocardia amamiensis TaxID=404578 RepID=A0ABS0D1S3_9NOCA|nr:DUF6262 family protein [Nocardia amamiensis]MBF6302798.1 hypothetical protein [Nocardia amamiensis]